MNTIPTAQEAVLDTRRQLGAQPGLNRRSRHHFTRSVVMSCPQGCRIELGQVLASFIMDGVRHIHLAGPEGGRIKNLVDAILTRGEFDVQLTTVWYEGETLDSVISFARGYCHQPPGGTQIVYL